jgi:hypothetical protein
MGTDVQLPIQFGRPKPVDPHVDEQLLVDFLRGKKDWTLCSTIEVALGWDDRKVREVASGSLYVIGRIGSPGYKFIHNATPDEYAHYRRARRSSARKLLARIFATDKVYYGHPAALP